VEISMLRAEEPLPQGHFDAAHYRAVHHHLFQDVYAWAGQYRTVRIAKGANSFCYPEHIAAQMEILFRQLRAGEALEHLDEPAFVDTIARFLSELNAIHPFREGNGRTQLTFIGLLGETSAHPFVFEKLDRDTFLAAMIASFSGELKPLRDELAALLR